jgi:hypothetical protein
VPETFSERVGVLEHAPSQQQSLAFCTVVSGLNAAN